MSRTATHHHKATMTPRETARLWAIKTLQQAGLNPEHHHETCRALAQLYEGLLA